MPSVASVEDNDYDGVAKGLEDNEKAGGTATKSGGEKIDADGENIDHQSFDYKAWLTSFEEAEDGPRLIEIILELPQVKQRYGRTQMINLACAFLKQKTLKNGFKDHQRIIKLNKNGKFSFTSLPYKKVGSKLLQSLGSNMDSSCDFWNSLKQPIILVVREATDLFIKPADARIAIETHKWAFVAHTMKDPATSETWKELSEGPPSEPEFDEDSEKWYDERYQKICDIGKANSDSYTNCFGDKDFLYENPDTAEVREKKNPLRGIDPKLGVMSDPQQFREIKNKVVHDYTNLKSYMEFSGNTDNTLDRIMFVCVQGNVFRTRLFYISCVFHQEDIVGLKSKDSVLPNSTSESKHQNSNESEHRLIHPDEAPPSFAQFSKKTRVKFKHKTESNKRARQTDDAEEANHLDEQVVQLEKTKQQQMVLLEKDRIEKELDFKRAEFILKNVGIFDDEEVNYAKSFMSLKKRMET